MGRAKPDIHGLLEEGLTCYGRGDLDGALTSWEQVLALDPHHEQALGYIDYVRMNYELLASEVSGHGEPAPFPIAGDEPEHRIDAPNGELATGSAVPRYGAAPDGWAIDEEEPGYGRMTVKQLTFELDPEEGELELEPFHAAEASDSAEITGLSFDDATTEYAGAGRRSEPLIDDGTPHEVELEITPSPGFEPEETPGFGTPADLQTPQGFGAQLTELRPRDLGFVQPVAPPPAAPPPAATAGTPGAPGLEHRRATASAPELQMTLRTPGGPGGPDELDVSPVVEVVSDVTLRDPFDASPDLDPPTIERSPDGPAGELMASLPTRRVPRTIGSTREMPAATRKPAPVELSVTALRTRELSVRSAVTPVPPAAPTAPTPPPAAPSTAPAPPPALPGPRPTIEGLPPVRTQAPIPPPPAARADLQDFDVPTQRKKDDRDRTPAPDLAAGSARDAILGTRPGARPGASVMVDINPLISAPTRDLGLRPGSATPRPSTEDEATGPVEAAPPLRVPVGQAEPMHTRADMVLPFDPIDARSQQILSAIDAHVPPPAGESREDQTRRRIAALFEHAIEWSKADELDRAVAAIDLALSEDPNSALAQKLIHRNRETIMNVFQAFLGDLRRTPILARPLHELADSPISPRAAFLLSRVDGLLSIDEILDVSGMPRIEAYRYLCQLFLRGILR